MDVVPSGTRDQPAAGRIEGAQSARLEPLPYNREAPDKYRLDPHSGEIPFDWSLPDG